MTPERDDVVSLDLGAGQLVLGEWLRVQQPRAVVLALHDTAADLDTLRPFARQLSRLTISTLMLDLPGHGLSGGTWHEHGEHAVSGALRECARTGLPVSILAVGASAQLALGQPEPAVSLVVVSPSLSVENLNDAEAWRTTPLLTIIDSTDARGAEVQAALGRWSRGWYVRMNGHYGSGGAIDTGWVPQITHAAAAFAAEQFAYHSAKQPRA